MTKPLTDRDKSRLADLQTRPPEMLSPWLRGELAELERRQKESQ